MHNGASAQDKRTDGSPATASGKADVNTCSDNRQRRSSSPDVDVSQTTPKWLEPLSESAQVAQPQGLTKKPDPVLASCLALSAQNHPDLAAVVAAWADLPEAVRVGIVAMVKAARGDGKVTQ